MTGARIAPNGAVAVAYGDKPARAAKRKSSIRIGKFRKVVRGGLRGYVNVTWLAGGQHLCECGVFVGPNGPFVALPSAPVIGADGRQVVVDGRKLYQQQVLWRGRARGDAFSAAVLQALLKKYPDALEREPVDDEAAE